MKLIAHLEYTDGVRREQSLKAHCREAADYADGSIGCAGLAKTAYISGLLHDMGKAKQEYVDYIEAAAKGEPVIRGSVNHTFAAVIWLLEHFHGPEASQWERLTSELLAFSIGSHHGMFDCVNLDGENGFLHRLQKDREDLHYTETIQNYFSQVAEKNKITECFYEAVGEIKAFLTSIKSAAIENYGADKATAGKQAGLQMRMQMSLLARLLLSATVYGDRKSTGEFVRGQKAPDTQPCNWTERQAFFEEKLKSFKDVSPLDQVRRSISEQCLTFAGKPSGIYKLNVPTGGGKTLASLRYALEHARRYKKRRIIFIIPLLSVLDQNVKVIREYLPDSSEILEHHSNVVKEKSEKEELDSFEFMAESWNYPVIVSTLVQLLEILFSSKMSAIGRMQALCESVIVIDEVQSLPTRLPAMFNGAVNFLSEACHASVILCSATQPCFDEIKWPMHLSGEPDMVSLDSRQMQAFQRSRIINLVDPYGMDWGTCENFLQELIYRYHSVLVICNTRREAKTLYERLKKQNATVYHLSTSMCQQHRSDVLDKIYQDLAAVQDASRAGKSMEGMICVATQLVEAGIDFSFEAVVRVLAGIDNLAQAAGRCNRSNEYGKEGCVYLIRLKDENLSRLPDISASQNATERVLEELKDRTDVSLTDPGAVRCFYRYLFGELGKKMEYPVKLEEQGGENLYYLARLLANECAYGKTGKNRSFILHQPFRTLGQTFTVFEENTVDVLVPYAEEGKRLTEQFRHINPLHVNWDEIAALLNEAKRYTVSLFEWQRKSLSDAGLLTEMMDRRILLLDRHAYDDCGVCIDAQQPVERFIL